MDVVDFVLHNGGVDVSKIVATQNSIKARCKKTWKETNIEFYGSHSIEEIRDRLILKATPSELKFKKYLDDHKITYEFQKIIRMPKGYHYIVDFYLPLKNKIIEIDGKYHEWPEAKFNDDIKTQNLKNMGYKIKRITNEEIQRFL